MLEGITVIEEFQFFDIKLASAIVATLFMIVMCGFVFYIFSRDFGCIVPSIRVTSIIASIVVVVMGVVSVVVITYATIESQRNPRTGYKVVISDDVGYNEFIRRYEILRQDGNILSITEKDNSK